MSQDWDQEIKLRGKALHFHGLGKPKIPEIPNSISDGQEVIGR